MPCLVLLLVLALSLRLVLVLTRSCSRTISRRAYDGLVILVLGVHFPAADHSRLCLAGEHHRPLTVNLIVLVVAVIIDVGGLAAARGTASATDGLT